MHRIIDSGLRNVCELHLTGDCELTLLCSNSITRATYARNATRRSLLLKLIS